MSTRAFRPTGNTITISVTSSSVPTPMPTFDNTSNAVVRVLARGTVDCFIRFGQDGTAASASNDIPIGFGLPAEYFDVPINTKFFSVIAPTGSPTIYLTPGKYMS